MNPPASITSAPSPTSAATSSRSAAPTAERPRSSGLPAAPTAEPGTPIPSITEAGSTPSPRPFAERDYGCKAPLLPAAIRECRTELRNIAELFPLVRRGFFDGDVRDWPAWAGGECPFCGAFTRAACWQAEDSVPCAACVISPPFFSARSLFAYEGNVREGILAAKYAKGKVPADALAERLWAAIRGRWSDRFPDGFRPTVVPVPIRPWKYFRRGFNLPALVGSALSRRAGWPFDPRILRRSGRNLPQAGQNAAARRENVRGVFRADAGRPVPCDALLLDDVYTSGATAREAALALKTAGAENIVVLTVARTVP